MPKKKYRPPGLVPEGHQPFHVPKKKYKKKRGRPVRTLAHKQEEVRKFIDPDNLTGLRTARRTWREAEGFGPTKGSKLSRALASVISAVLHQRGMGLVEATRVWGCHENTARMVLDGTRLPNRELAARIKRWIFENVTWEFSPQLPAVAPHEYKRPVYVVIPVPVPAENVEKLKQLAAESGESVNVWIELAIGRILNGEATITTYKEAMDHVMEARMHETLRQAPEMAEILETDHALAKRLGELIPTPATLKEPADVRQAIANTVTHGGWVVQPLGDANADEPWDLEI